MPRKATTSSSRGGREKAKDPLPAAADSENTEFDSDFEKDLRDEETESETEESSKAPVLEVGAIVFARQDQTKAYHLCRIVDKNIEGTQLQVEWVSNQVKSWVQNTPKFFQSSEKKRRRKPAVAFAAKSEDSKRMKKNPSIPRPEKKTIKKKKQEKEKFEYESIEKEERVGREAEYFDYIGKLFKDTEDGMTFKIASVSRLVYFGREDLFFRYYDYDKFKDDLPKSLKQFEHTPCEEILNESTGAWVQWI